MHDKQRARTTSGPAAHPLDWRVLERVRPPAAATHAGRVIRLEIMQHKNVPFIHNSQVCLWGGWHDPESDTESYDPMKRESAF